MEGRVINIDSEILGGTPVFYGTRVPIKNLFDYLETGETIETFLDDFEGVKREQVVKVLEMSQKLIETSTGILNENFAWRMCDQATKTFSAWCWSVHRHRDALERHQEREVAPVVRGEWFRLVVDIDKNMMHQQNLDKFDITIVVLDSLTSKVEELKLFIPIELCY